MAVFSLGMTLWSVLIGGGGSSWGQAADLWKQAVCERGVTCGGSSSCNVARPRCMLGLGPGQTPHVCASGTTDGERRCWRRAGNVPAARLGHRFTGLLRSAQVNKLLALFLYSPNDADADEYAEQRSLPKIDAAVATIGWTMMAILR